MIKTILKIVKNKSLSLYTHTQNQQFLQHQQFLQNPFNKKDSHILSTKKRGEIHLAFALYRSKNLIYNIVGAGAHDRPLNLHKPWRDVEGAVPYNLFFVLYGNKYRNKNKAK